MVTSRPLILLTTITMSGVPSSPPAKRTRHDNNGNPSARRDSLPLPPLSLSIVGVEPLDEFIREVADFVHHMVMTRPDYAGSRVEVEAKIGVLRDRMTGQRLALPVRVETSTYPFLSLSHIRRRMRRLTGLSYSFGARPRHTLRVEHDRCTYHPTNAQETELFMRVATTQALQCAPQ